MGIFGEAVIHTKGVYHLHKSMCFNCIKREGIVNIESSIMDQAKYNELKKEWTVEGIKDSQLTLDGVDAKQSVCIANCQDTFVKITGKVSHVLMINCKKVGVVFDTVVASFEVMRCNSVEIQSMTDVKLMSVERSEGVTLYINKESVDNVRVVTNNASQVNVVVPRSDPENKDETIMVSKSVVEQFVTSIDKATGDLVTKPIDRANDYM